ncbi:MAG: hypothetical protein PVI92_16025 [Chromatiales bacterium]|jgi:hypothetical protein
MSIIFAVAMDSEGRADLREVSVPNGTDMTRVATAKMLDAGYREPILVFDDPSGAAILRAANMLLQHTEGYGIETLKAAHKMLGKVGQALMAGDQLDADHPLMGYITDSDRLQSADRRGRPDPCVPGDPQAHERQELVILACRNAAGKPDMAAFIVECDQQEYETGDYIQTAIQNAFKAGYQQPFLALSGDTDSVVLGVANQVIERSEGVSLDTMRESHCLLSEAREHVDMGNNLVADSQLGQQIIDFLKNLLDLLVACLQGRLREQLNGTTESGASQMDTTLGAI